MEWLLDWGYFGLFIGSFLAATIIPFSSDILMVGMLVAGADPLTCVIVATLGNWLGGLTSYGIGWIGKWEWIEKWFKIKEEKLIRQKKYIDRYGVWLAFFTWLPFIGDLLAIALGFYKINPFISGLCMLIGRFIRFLVWTLLYLKFAERFVEFIT